MPAIQEQLKEHLKNGGDWEKMETPVDGVYIVKVPKSKNQAARLNIEINPLREDGRPFKKTGLFIGSKDVLIGFAEAMNDDKSFQLMQLLDYINARKPIPFEEIKVEEEKKRVIQELVEEETEKEIEIEVEKELENRIDVVDTDELENEDELEEEISLSTESLEEGKRIYVDIANLLYSDKDSQGKLKVENIGPIYETLKLYDYKPIFIADAAILHKINNVEEYETLIQKGIVRVAPAGRTADVFILKMAQKNNCMFLTNDLFRDHYEEFDKDWIKENRITYMFEDGELILD